MLTVLAPTALVLSLSVATPIQEAPAYTLVWSDDFDRDGAPDRRNWAYDTHANATGWYNNEAQYYSGDRRENARVENGVLIIEARREQLRRAADYGGQAYTSARMNSRASWTYGRFEARMKLPCARGTWPAFWMLPTGDARWPDGGEIDILEHVGHRPGQVHGTIHTRAYNHVQRTERQGSIAVPDACETFHVYGAEWTADAVVFTLDGQPYYRFDREAEGGRATWPFDRPFHLILNVAVGGDWGGAEGIDDAALPQRMEVDWVRVWRKAE